MKILIALGSLAASLACAPGVPLERLITWPEYYGTVHPTPYILRVEAKQGSLLYFGARHMKGEPDHPQVAQIEALWRQFRPTIAFNEGWDPPVMSDLRESVRLYGEPGLLRHLARRDGVPIDDMEPPETGRYRHLLRRFSVEEIRLHQIAGNVAQNLSPLPAEEVDRQVLGQIRRHLETEPLLAGPPHSIAEVEEAFRRLLPDLEDWRRIPQTALYPNPRKTFLNEISSDLGTFRDRHMVTLLVRSVRRGERVFAVVGASHVVVQEPVLRGAFGKIELLSADAGRPGPGPGSADRVD